MSLFYEKRHVFPAYAAQIAAATLRGTSPQSRVERFRKPTLPLVLVATGVAEFLSIAASGSAVAVGLQIWLKLPPGLNTQFVAVACLAAFLEIVIVATRSDFQHLQAGSFRFFLLSGLVSVTLTFLLMACIPFIVGTPDIYPREILAAQFLSACAASLGLRSAVFERFTESSAAGTVRGRRVILVGRRDNFAQHIERLKSLRHDVQLLCCAIPPANAPVSSYLDANALAAALVDECRAMQADDIVLLADETRQDELKQITQKFKEIPAAIYTMPSRHWKLCRSAMTVQVAGAAAFSISEPALSGASRFLKRGFDILAATIALLVLSPLFAIAALAISMDSKGPVLFRQIRHGYNNQAIRVFKFRTMHVSDETHFRQTSKGDPRITRVGRIFRITGIDELPQLVNILRGEMSIVGPRPHAVLHNQMFSSHIARFARRHNVLPGITGWAQVNGYRGETDTMEKMIRRIECDLYYVDNWSLLLDLKIIMLTLFSKRTYLNAG